MKKRYILAIGIIVAIALIIAANVEAVKTGPEIIGGDTSGGFDVSVVVTPSVNINNSVTNVGVSIVAKPGNARHMLKHSSSGFSIPIPDGEEYPSCQMAR